VQLIPIRSETSFGGVSIYKHPLKMSSQDSKDVTSSVSKLSLDTQNSKTPARPKAKKEQLVDSWEDEDVSSDTETETGVTSKPAPSEGDPQGTSAPPPTPVTPSYGQATFTPADPAGGYHIPTGSPAGGAQAARPEKTDAVARRMIAGALGMRAPKLTEEQKNYDKAVREKERKRREEEKAAQRRREEEAAKAKAAMWDD
jgi:hypothetical protein